VVSEMQRRSLIQQNCTVDSIPCTRTRVAAGVRLASWCSTPLLGPDFWAAVEWRLASSREVRLPCPECTSSRSGGTGAAVYLDPRSLADKVVDDAGVPLACCCRRQFFFVAHLEGARIHQVSPICSQTGSSSVVPPRHAGHEDRVVAAPYNVEVHGAVSIPDHWYREVQFLVAAAAHADAARAAPVERADAAGEDPAPNLREGRR